MNVALTRAKSSVFIVGNMPTLERSDEMWKTIIDDARGRGLFVEAVRHIVSQNFKLTIISEQHVFHGVFKQQVTFDTRQGTYRICFEADNFQGRRLHTSPTSYRTLYS